MLVKDLVEELQKYPPDTPVLLYVYDSDESSWIGEPSLELQLVRFTKSGELASSWVHEDHIEEAYKAVVLRQ
jgi:hypothetical protein